MKGLFLLILGFAISAFIVLSIAVQNISLSFNNFINDNLRTHSKDPITIPSGIHKVGSSGSSNSTQDSTGGITATVAMGSDKISDVNGESYMLITLEGDELPTREVVQRKPINLAIVIDRSGSMSGEKLSYVKSALHNIGSYLNENDRVSLIVYDNSVQTLISSQSFNEERFIYAVERIEDGGSTNLEGGLREGLDQVESGDFYNENEYSNRVILLSDGLANVGIDSASGLANIVKKSQYEGTKVSTIGVGADYDERIMTAIAQAGRGNYYFMESPRSAQDIFTKEFRNVTQIVARDIKVVMDIDEWSANISGIGYEHDGGNTFQPYDIQAGGKTTYLFAIKAQDFSYFKKNINDRNITFANVVVEFESQKTGRRERIELPVNIQVVSGDVNPLSNDDVYSEYMRSYAAEELLNVYEDLDAHNNSVAQDSLDEVYRNIKQANIRLNGLFDAELKEVEDKQRFVDDLDDDFVKDTSRGRIFQKSVQSESYSRVYNK